MVTRKIDQIIITSKMGQVIKLPLKNIPQLGRATQGVILMRFAESDLVKIFSNLSFILNKGISKDFQESHDKFFEFSQKNRLKSLVGHFFYNPKDSRNSQVHSLLPGQSH